jgi:hypothetical protein
MVLKIPEPMIAAIPNAVVADLKRLLGREAPCLHFSRSDSRKSPVDGFSAGVRTA